MPEPVFSFEERLAQAMLAWQQAGPVEGTAGAAWLASLGLDHLEASPELRFDAVTFGGALVAIMRDPLGQPAGIVRHYVGEGCTAADGFLRSSRGPCWFASAHISEAAPELLVGGQLETAAAAGRLLDLPVWVARRRKALREVVLPPIVRRVVLACDRNATAHALARVVASRWKAEGRHVRIVMPQAPHETWTAALLAS